jgi:hypothetical protein
MEITFNVNFIPFNVCITNDRLLVFNNNNSGDWKEFRHTLSEGNWKVKKVGKRSVTISK